MTLANIIKRDGREVPFDITKISDAIGKAFYSIGNYPDVDCGALAANVVDTLDSIEKEGPPTVEEVQDIVEQELIKDGYTDVAKAYIIYRSERTKVREMKSDLMKTFEEITFTDGKDSDIKRENANINGEAPMGAMLKYGSEASKQFYQLFCMKPEHARAHSDGYIHVHAPTGTCTCCQIDLIDLFKDGFHTGHGFLREPNSIMTYSALACIAVQSNQNLMHGGQSIVNFDYSMAEGVTKSYKNHTKDNLAKALRLIAGVKEEDAKSFAKWFVKESIHKDSIKMSNDYASVLKLAMGTMLGEEVGSYSDKVYNFVKEEAYNETDRETYQAMEAFIHNLNTMHSRAGAQTPFSSINFGLDTTEEGRMAIKNLLLATEAGLGHGETPIFPISIMRVKEGINYNPGDPNYDLFKLAIRCSCKRLFPKLIGAIYRNVYRKPCELNMRCVLCSYLFYE